MTDFYEIDTAAAGLPIVLGDTKEFMRVDHPGDDDLIQSLIDVANNQGEKYTNRTFVKQTYVGKFSMLETSQYERYSFLTLRRSPLIVVNNVKVVLNDELTTVSTADYQVKEMSGFSRILFTEIPSCDDVPYPLEVNFDAGYATASVVPEGIKTAMKQHILFFYENRGDVMPDGKNTIPKVVKAIYSKFRILNTFG